MLSFVLVRHRRHLHAQSIGAGSGRRLASAEGAAPRLGGSIAGWVFYVGAPAAAYSGYSGAYLRWVGFSDRAMKGAMPGGPGLRSAYDVELRVRYILRDVIVDEKKQHAGSHGHGTVAAGRVPSTSAAQETSRAPDALHHHHHHHDHGGDLIHPRHAEGGSAGPHAYAAPGLEAEGHGELLIGGSAPGLVRSDRRGSQARASQVVPGLAAEVAAAYDSPVAVAEGGHAGAATRGHHHFGHGLHHEPVVSPRERSALLETAAALMEASCAAFPTAAIADLLRANFIRVFIGDADAELSCLVSGLTKSPSLDVRFLLLQAKQQLQEQSEEGVAAARSVHGEHRGAQHSDVPHRVKLSIVEKVQYEKRACDDALCLSRWGVRRLYYCFVYSLPARSRRREHRVGSQEPLPRAVILVRTFASEAFPFAHALAEREHVSSNCARADVL